MREGEMEAFTKWNFGSGEPVQNAKMVQGSFHRMKLWLKWTCAEWEKGQWKHLQNETVAKANLCRMREGAREAFIKRNFDSGEPVQNERRENGTLDKMKTLAQANLCRIKEGERKPFTKWNFGSGEPVQNERRGKGSFYKMKRWPRRTCAESEKAKGKLS